MFQWGKLNSLNSLTKPRKGWLGQSRGIGETQRAGLRVAVLAEIHIWWVNHIHSLSWEVFSWEPSSLHWWGQRWRPDSLHEQRGGACKGRNHSHQRLASQPSFPGVRVEDSACHYCRLSVPIVSKVFLGARSPNKMPVYLNQFLSLQSPARQLRLWTPTPNSTSLRSQGKGFLLNPIPNSRTCWVFCLRLPLVFVKCSCHLFF